MIIVQSGFTCSIKKGKGTKKVVIMAANKDEAERIGRHYFNAFHDGSFMVKKHKLVIHDEQ